MEGEEGKGIDAKAKGKQSFKLMSTAEIKAKVTRHLSILTYHRVICLTRKTTKRGRT